MLNCPSSGNRGEKQEVHVPARMPLRRNGGSFMKSKDREEDD